MRDQGANVQATRPEPAATAAPSPRKRSPRERLLDVGQRYALVIVWVAIILLFGLFGPSAFLTAANFQTIFGSQAVLVVLSLGLLIPLTAGDYDLSVASVLSLAGMLIAVLNVEHGWPVGAAVVAAIVMGAVVGFVNGALIVMLRLDSFIVTLGSSTFITGIVLWISHSNTIGGISQHLVDPVITWSLFGIPLGFYYGVVLCVVMWFVFEYTPLGRRLLFVGRGRAVARLSGIRVGRVRWGSFVMSGTISAIAGVMYAATQGGADPSSGATFLLPAFAAAFLGATSIIPGRFNPWGSLIAVYTLVTGITALQLLGVQSFVQQLFYGGALIVAVALSQIARRGTDASPDA